MRRAGLIVVVLLVILAGAAVLGGNALLNTGPVRARLAEAVQRATGHALRLDGPLTLTWSPIPAIAVRDVALLNPPGFSRPEFVTARAIEARMALLPLLSGRVELRQLTLDGVDALLERDASGRGNWLPPATPEAVPATPSTPGSHVAVEIAQATVRDARIAWRGAPPAEINLLEFAPSGGPLSGTITVNGVALALQGKSAPVSMPGFPFDFTLAGGGATLAVSGQGGGPVAFQAAAPDLAAVSALAGSALPPVQNVHLTGQLGPGGPADLHLTTGAAALGAYLPGAQLVQLDVTAAAIDQPVKLLAQAAVNALPVAVALELGRWPTPGTAAPLALQLTADGATVAVQGSVAGGAIRSLQATLSARVPDLQRTGMLAGAVLPNLRDLALDLRMLPVPGGGGLLLRGVRLTSAQGDVAGDLAITTRPRPSLRGSLVSQRMDWDAAASPAPMPSPAPGGPAPTTPTPAEPPAEPAVSGWDRPLPFAVLRRADADVRLAVGQATYHGASYRAIDLRLLLQDGRLQLDPLQMLSPGGVVRGRLQADANPAPPTASIALHAPGLDGAGLAAAVGAPGAASGTLVDLDLELRGAGADLHAMAGTLDGHLSLGLVDGELDNALLVGLFGPALRNANLPADAAGRSHVRCLALRLVAAAGQATVQTLALDTTRLRLEGDGVLDLAREEMDMHLRPIIRIGGAGVSVPVRLVGPFRAPRASSDKGVLAPGRFGLSIGGAQPDICAPALAALHQAPTP